MSCSSKPTSATHQIAAVTSSDIDEYFTDFLPATGLDYVAIAMLIAQSAGNLRTQIIYQTADVRPSKPNAAVAIGVQKTGNQNYALGKTSIATNTAAAMWVRFGVRYSVASGVDQGAVTLTVTDDGCGRFLGTRSLSLNTNSATAAAVPISAWIPALLAEQVKAAFVSSGLVGAFEFKLCMRTADYDPNVPGSWTSLEQTYRTTTTEACTGEIATGITTALWVQFGVMFHILSGTFGAMNIEATVAVRS